MPSLHPHPTKPGTYVSRQTIWQLKRKAEGKCITCGQPRVTKTHCRSCADKQAARWKRWYRNLTKKPAVLAAVEG